MGRLPILAMKVRRNHVNHKKLYKPTERISHQKPQKMKEKKEKVKPTKSFGMD